MICIMIMIISFVAAPRFASHQFQMNHKIKLIVSYIITLYDCMIIVLMLDINFSAIIDLCRTKTLFMMITG